MTERNAKVLERLQKKIRVEESHGCRLSYAAIDPLMATELLELSKGNRPLSKKTVAKYRRHMENGTWDQDTPTQFIMFDEDGVLINGHHTLTALRQSGKTVRLFFMFNVKKSPYIDGGRTRSEADRFCMADKRGEVSGYRRAVAMCNVITQCTPVKLVTEDERYNYIHLYPEAFRWAGENLSMSKARLSTAPVRTALLLARIAGASAVKMEHFWEVLMTGFSKDPNDRTIIKLRDWLKDLGDSRSLQYRRSVLNTVSFVLKKWLDGEKVKIEDKDQLCIWEPEKK